jgi:aromatic amino acid aminotransferase I / 2-aminoadipate transaminase
VHFESHPSHSSVGYKELEEKLFIDLAEAGVLFGPGIFFAGDSQPFC